MSVEGCSNSFAISRSVPGGGRYLIDRFPWTTYTYMYFDSPVLHHGDKKSNHELPHETEVQHNQFSSQKRSTIPETNIAPENGWLDKITYLLGPGLFSGALAVSFTEGSFYSLQLNRQLRDLQPHPSAQLGSKFFPFNS